MKSKLRKLCQFPEFISILNTIWRIQIKNYEEDPYFKKNSADGYCSDPDKSIVICDWDTWPDCENESDEFKSNAMKVTLRHELVHAYLYESGLADSSFRYSGNWANNEEMVDWIARQGPKIYLTWQACGCLTPMNPERYMKWKAVEEK